MPVKRSVEIIKVIKRIPTEFVAVNGELFSLEDFRVWREVLEGLKVKPRERRLLDPNTLDLFEQAGVVEFYRASDSDGYGGTLHWEMMRKGKRYEEFTRVLKAYDAKRHLEMVEVSREAEKKDLRRRLRELDKPRSRRSIETAAALGDI